MAIDWLHGFFVPLIEIIFIGGIICGVSYWIGKGFWNAWSKSAKFFWKFRIMKKAYPEKTLKWCLDAIDQGIGYYDCKKLLMVKMVEQDQINETMWIYDQILNEMKGGMKENDRGFKASHSKDQSKAELPSI